MEVSLGSFRSRCQDKIRSAEGYCKEIVTKDGGDRKRNIQV